MKNTSIDKAFVIILLIFCTCEISNCQEARIVYKFSNLQTKEPPGLMLKWYSKNLINSEGYNIYRLEFPGGTRAKCNISPVRPMLYDDELLKSIDSSLLIFAELLKRNPEVLKEGLLQLHLLIQSFKSIQFSKLLGIYFLDSCLNPSFKYLYQVYKIKEGKEHELAISDTLQISQFGAIRTIHNFVCSQKKNKIELKWLPEDSLFFAVNIYRKDLLSNKIYRRNNDPIMISQNENKSGEYKLPKVFFTDTFDTRKSAFIYFLKGIDFFGDEIYYSDSLKIIARDSIPPAVVGNLKLIKKNNFVIISWTKPADGDFKGCSVYRSLRTDMAFSPINQQLIEGTSQFFIDSLPDTGPRYYKVGSIDSSGNESFSEKLYIEIHDITAPETPGNIVLAQDSGRVYVRWSKNKEKDLAGYLLYRSLVKNKALKPILMNSTPLKDTFYVDKAISKKSDIIYQLAAIDSSSNISMRSLPVKIQILDRIPPVKPKITSIILEDKTAKLYWLRNPDSDLASYKLHRRTVNSPEVIFSICVDSVSFIDTCLMPENKYEYEIQALDSAGNFSVLSNTVSICIRKSEVINNCPNIILKGKTKKYNKLQWELNSNDGLIGYSVFLFDSLNSYSRISDVFLNNEFIDKNTINGRKYQYQLRSYFTNGEICFSQPVILKTPDK